MSDATLLIAIVAIAAAMLAWLAIDIGTRTLASYRATFTERARFQAREFFLFIDPRRLYMANIAVMALGAMTAWLGTGRVLLAIPVFFALALMPRILYSTMRKRRLNQFEQQLPDALMLLAGGMRAGVGLASALQQLVAESEAPLSQEFALMLREQRLGAPLEQALSGLAHRVPTQTTSLVVSAMRIANETGGGLAETLERCAHTIRSRRP
jgi:tight adherence protein B